jgi:heme exporter protein A
VTPSAIEAAGLEKWFGPVPAVRGISLRLERGETLAIFGPNGSGKTTLLRMLAGAVSPTRGTVRVDGGRAALGMLSHQSYLYGLLTAAENLAFFGRLYHLPDLSGRVRRALEEVGLADRAEARVNTFSRGMRQRLALARTLLHDPTVVLLDEPFTGLDVNAARTLRRQLERLRGEGRTVVLVTHNVREGYALADRVAVQRGGRWVLEARCDEIGWDALEERYHDLFSTAA